MIPSVPTSVPSLSLETRIHNRLNTVLDHIEDSIQHDPDSHLYKYTQFRNINLRSYNPVYDYSAKDDIVEGTCEQWTNFGVEAH